MALPLAITGCGLVSSVGRSLVETCASIRAGINRVKPVTHFSVLDPDTQAEAPLRGHPVAGVTDGFGPSARWLALARLALGDLLEGRKAAEVAKDQSWSRCGVVFVLPVLDDARFFTAAPARPEAVWSTCLDPLLAGQGLTIGPMHRGLVQIGAGGIGQAFEVASAWLEKRAVERVLVVAVDSLLDAWSLNWLATAGRLKDPENPVGLAPGEAAVALVLERATTGREAPLARIRSVAFEEVDQPFQNAERRQGRGLVAALRRALAGSGAMNGDLYVNLNGEEWRAAELGNALTAMPAGTLGNYRLVVPAICVGDVGAAAGALQIACAVRSFARGYAAAPQAWIIATSDYGDVSTLCLEGG